MWQKITRKRNKERAHYWKYLKVVIVVYIHFTILAAYVIFYRQVPDDAQFLLIFVSPSPSSSTVRSYLGFTDSFPIQMAMLLSGFWIENMSDIVRFLLAAAKAPFHTLLRDSCKHWHIPTSRARPLTYISGYLTSLPNFPISHF